VSVTSWPYAESLPCHAMDPDIFFSRRPADVAAAKTACSRCLFQEQCLGRALHQAEPWGVWGGETFLRGAIVEELRPPGRPPKAQVA